MSYAGGRPLSPPRNRYHPPSGPPGRTSAGSFFYDPHPTPTRSSRDYATGPRISAERIGESRDALRVVPLRARSPPRKIDDYAVRPRPRRATLEPDAPRIRRPFSMIAPPSDTRSSRPIITSAIDRPPSPVTVVRRERRDDEYQVLPASSSSRRHHTRQSSLGTTDTGRLFPSDRDARGKVYRSSNLSRPALRERQGENDRDYGYEYTDARETKPQDPIYRQKSRRDSYNNGGRPTSMIIPEGYIARSNRDPGPPVSSRGFENIERSQSLRQGYRARDDERVPRDYVRDDRETSSRKPVRPEIALHQPSDDGYVEEDFRHHRARKHAPEDDRIEPRPRPRKEEERLEPKARDTHDDRLDRGDEDRHRKHRHKHHHHRDDDEREERDRRARDDPRDKREKEEDGRSVNGMLAGAGAAAAATGLAVEGARRHRQKDSRDEADVRPARRPRDEDGESRSTRRPRDEEEEISSIRRPRDHLREPERDALETSSVSTGPSVSTGEDREYEEARQEERRARHDAEAFIGPVELALRERASYERRPEPNYERHHRTYRPRRHHSRTRDQDSHSSSSYSSSSDSGDGDRIPRNPRVVTPSPEEEQKREPPPPPKSILRKPRERFPEHPATEREGVAPHKDAVKKNVPPGARWTKIRRELVNPESLEQDGIRFNEFEDHVIVLKVMDAEEIMKYAKKTAEIRANRRMLMAPSPGDVGSGAGSGSGSATEAPPAPPASSHHDGL